MNFNSLSHIDLPISLRDSFGINRTSRSFPLSHDLDIAYIYVGVVGNTSFHKCFFQVIYLVLANLIGGIHHLLV